VWPYNNGICLVKSALKYLFQTKNVPAEKSLWNWIWKLLCSKKIQFFIWKAMHNRVPTWQYLAFSRPYISDHYPRCNNLETTIHILRDCLWAKEVWCHSPGVLPLTFFQLPLQLGVSRVPEDSSKPISSIGTDPSQPDRHLR